MLPTRRPHTRARRFHGPRRRRPRVFVARFDRSLQTRVVTRPAGKTAPSAGIPAMDPHLADHQRKSEDPSGEAPPQLPGRPSGTPGDRQHARDGPAASLGPPNNTAPSARSLHTVTSRHPFAPPARAARLRRPPAPPARAAYSRRPLAPPACVRHAVLLVLRRFGGDARDVSTGQLAHHSRRSGAFQRRGASAGETVRVDEWVRCLLCPHVRPRPASAAGAWRVGMQGGRDAVAVAGPFAL